LTDPRRLAWLITAALISFGGGCSRQSLPRTASNQYREFVSAFYVGLAGLQTGEDVRAREKLTAATQIVPGEPAAWADLALLAVRQQEFDAAAADAQKALELAPDNSRIEALAGVIESKRGKLPEAISHLHKAVELDGKNLRALYALAEETERQATPEGDAGAQKLFEQVLSQQPGNLAVQLEITRLAAKRGDTAALQSTVNRLAAESSNWPDEARQRFTALQQTASGPNPRAAAVQAAFLRNVLTRLTAYRQSLNAVKTPAAFVGEPFTRFIKLPTPSSEPAPADTSLNFTSRSTVGAPTTGVTWAGAFPLEDSGRQTLVWAGTFGVQVSGGALLEAPKGPIGRHGVAPADLNYVFKNGIIIANHSGVRLYQQKDQFHFVDLTPRSKIPADVAGGAYTGAWPFDVDLDGDLDVVLGAVGRDPTVLRNNGDATFAVIHPFSGVSSMVSFAAADIDGDGAPDVAMVDASGGLHVFTNERLGVFRPRPLPTELQGHFVAVAAGDINGDGMPDFVILRDDGSVVRLSDRNSGTAWEIAELVKPAGAKLTEATANLILADFDNNGSLDLLAGDGRLYLHDAKGFTPVTFPAGITVTTAADLDNDGRLDLIGSDGSPVVLANHGTKNYYWQTLRLRAAKASGDQRINSFGIGGEVEVRAGLLTQKQIIQSPVLHFGLGDHLATDVTRIVWPNGSVQAEFELKTDQTVLAEQRLKGSCPFLFAWNGKQMDFVKDGEPWSPALGLHINAQTVAGISQTQEWFKVPGDKLAPREGYYDLRVTDELWETYYIDHYSLLVVDHPKDTEVFTDERFSNPPPPLKVFTVSKLQPFTYARDDNGADVSETVRSLDQKYLDTFGRGRYQGVTRDHWVELGLPASAPRSGPLYLIASGWTHPTDGTTNVALGQNSDPPPQSLRIEVPDANGKWVVAKANQGFLAGRLKTAVLDISQIFRPGAPRKLRLGTNLEIYWDQLSWATGLPDNITRIQHVRLAKADLHYRGFSVIHAANDSSPEIPDYNHLGGTSPKWRDLEGYATRYGDVWELLDQIDDRMVIANAGDELSLRFAAAPPPPAGFTRDFVMVGDGWIKDGDYNSTFSKTVLPLPYHAMKDYTRPPTTLEDDPGYRLHPQDWEQYHTRYVTPEFFIKALWN
jgi:Tfp pilus assembly protein PilF